MEKCKKHQVLPMPIKEEEKQSGITDESSDQSNLPREIINQVKTVSNITSGSFEQICD